MIEGSITQIEENSKIVEEENIAYLEFVEQTEWIQNIRTNQTYTHLQQAIDETEAQDILQITQDYGQYEEVVIRENKDINLDLNGKTITTYGSVRNQGIFKILDTVGSGTITSQVGTTIIQNEGTVEVRRRNG